MKDYIYERVINIANYALESKATVRQLAKKFYVGKSTVHKDMIERLPKINKVLAVKVQDVLDFNKSERHIRGGASTQKKYKELY